jgi:uroporphyrinogen decarboxylase
VRAMSYHLQPHHVRLAEKFVAQTQAHGGLAPVDLKKFWEDNDRAGRDPFAADCPQVPLGIWMARDCVFTELGVEPDWYRMVHDEAYQLPLNKRYNDRAEQIVGRRLLPEQPSPPAHQWPEIKQLHDIFEAQNVWNVDSYWLMESAHTVDELRALLDRVEHRLANLRSFLLPAGWDAAKKRLLAAGAKVPLMRAIRGPVTFATSVFGPENLIYLILDNPDLAGRFRDLILRAIMERARILDEEAGWEPQGTDGRGFWFNDDNCQLLTAEMYEFFGFPILKTLFDKYAPRSTDTRYQHSDSDMAHLLPVLARLNFHMVNFGPKLTVAEIHQHMPRTVVQGQLAPFTFSRNEEVNIVAEFLRDFEMARNHKGLLFATAGSIHDGSRLTALRLIMAAIQQFGRYS